MIIVNNDELEFHIQTKSSSYIMKVLESGHLANLYYGTKIKHRDNFNSLNQNFKVALGSSTSYSSKLEPFNLDVSKLELATSGKGDYRDPSLHIIYADNSTISDFLFHSFEILDKKITFKNIPHTFDLTNKSKTLKVTLYESVKDVYINLYYSHFDDKDVIVRNIEVVNGNYAPIKLSKIMSFNLDIVNDDYKLMTLNGKWIKEAHIAVKDVSKGIYHIDSKKGVSSANHNPFMALFKDSNVYGFTLMYSGNHKGQVELNPHNLLRIQMGINDFDFQWNLDKGESFITPELVMTYSDEGLDKMSQNFHNLVNNNNIISPYWQYRERPVTANNWEATYFDFDEKKIVKLAKEAKKLGVELFVLDDGWFSNSDNDQSSLGDFFENKKKLPNGLKSLSHKINEIGLDFGIWVEPESISLKSELYKKHPEWMIKQDNREPSPGRFQYLLDMSNPDVIEYLFNELSDVFIHSNAKYVKWDMNRNFSDTYSSYLFKHQQLEFNHRYVLGLYSLLNRLKDKFPHILFESCSSGGNRFDLGMLYYMPQTWTSDNTDALERMYIQYGTSTVYPLSSMCTHISDKPSHQVLRHTPLETRFNVSAFGILGIALDFTKLSNWEKKVIKNQISFYKENRKLFQFGNLYKIVSPFESNNMIQQVVNDNRSESILAYYQKLQESNPGYEIIKLKGLNSDYLYDLITRKQYINVEKFGPLVNDELPFNIKMNGLIHSTIIKNYLYSEEVENRLVYGDELMYAGLRLTPQFSGTEYSDKVRFIGDFGSRLYKIKKMS